MTQLLATVLTLLSILNSPAQSSIPYTWKNVAIGGGGFVTGLVFHSHENNLLYARTDVGGAYRWDAPSQRWIPLTDSIQGFDLTGIESIAVDPSDANRVYLAAGIYRWTHAAILRSADRGQTWQTTEVPFKMGGNESGRFNGERLAVDPHDGQILFFGSRHDGLWRSADFGATWAKVESLPVVDTLEPLPPPPRATSGRRHSNPQEIGIVFVLCDSQGGPSNEPTQVLYVGASTAGTNFFRSADGGRTWSPVPGQPIGLRPNHGVLAPDGTIYLTYGKQPGPTSMSDGAVWKFNPQKNTWTDITPIKPADEDSSFGYGAVSVDAKNPSTLVVTTFARWHPHDEVFRSTNGGAKWIPLLETAQWNFSNASYTKGRTPHWMGTVVIDPSDSNHVLFTTGYGIWESKNLAAADTGKSVRWNFADDGLEETVPLALISPPEGAHLLSGIGDVDGFRHDDLDTPPSQGMFSGPRFSNTEDLAFAAKDPSTIVRVGTGGNNPSHGAISHDGGKTWVAFVHEPAGSIGAGSITISANAGTIVWTPRRGAPFFSHDSGTNWTSCAGLAAEVPVIADPENPECFYAFDTHTEKMFASTNGAESFFETTATFPPLNRSPYIWFSPRILSAAPGREGDLWLALPEVGLFHSTNGGANFAKLQNVPHATVVGFGKAAEGKTFPTLFLNGRIGGIQGIFRSIDAGAQWTRINDDAHQYGAVNYLVGDPRLFGRIYLATSGRGIIYGDELK